MENALILNPILSTKFVRKCVKTSLENLYIDIGAQGANFAHKLNILISYYFLSI